MHHRHGNRAARRPAFVGKTEIGRTANSLAEDIAEAQRVDEGRGMLDFARGPDDSRLAIGLNTVLTTTAIKDDRNKRLSQERRRGQNFGAQVFDKALARPRIVDIAATAIMRTGVEAGLPPSIKISS
jgi:hypothetical protein